MLKKKSAVEKIVVSIGLLIFGLFVSRAFAQNVAQGYQATQTLQPGILVQLVPKNGKEVEPVTQSNAAKTFGVVISQNEAPLSLSSNSNIAQTYVASSGVYDVLVSTEQGNVAIGDYIAVSAISGVGMVGNSNQETVIGKAVQTFNGKSGVISSETVKNSLGQQQTVQIGSVEVDLQVAHNPLYSVKDSNGVPGFLASIVKVITDKPVGALRIYASIVVLAVTVMLAGAVLYIGIRSSITAIGRNPLAKKSISKSLATVIMSALIVFIIGIIAVYLLLKL